MGRVLDGTGDYLSIADADPLLPGAEWTLSIWAYLDVSGDEGALISYQIVSDRIAYVIGIGVNGQISSVLGQLWVGQWSGSWNAVKDSGGAAPTGQWLHVAATRDASNLKLYRGGTEVGTIASAANPAQPADSDMYIGVQWSGSNFLNAKVGEVGIWPSKKLNTSEIASLARGVSPQLIQRNSLKLYLPITGTSSPERDYSGNGNHFSINGDSLPSVHPPVAPLVFPTTWVSSLAVIVKSGIGISESTGSGAQESALDRTGRGVSAFTGIGITEKDVSRFGEGVIEFAGAGSSDGVKEKEGEGVSAFDGIGASAIIYTETGAGVSERVAGGDQTQTQGNTGRGESTRVGSGEKSVTRVETGAGISARVGAGVQNRERQKAGRGVAAFAGGAPALIAATVQLTVDAWGTQYPTFLVDGPCSNPLLENVTRGKSLRVWVVVPTGDRLTVDCAARRITLESDMVWGYEGDFFEIGGSDVITAGAESASAPADITVVTQKVDGLRAKSGRGAGVSPHTGGGVRA